MLKNITKSQAVRRYLSVLLLSSWATASYAGVGWYVTIRNNTDQQLLVVAENENASKCWYLNDLQAPGQIIKPKSTAVLYTEENNSYLRGWQGCSGAGLFSGSSNKFVKFSINNNSILLSSNYNKKAAKSYRLSKNMSTGFRLEKSGKQDKMSAAHDTVTATIDVNSADSAAGIIPVSLDW